MKALTKKITDVCKEDLEELVRLKVKEGQRLEYKKESWGSRHEDKLEMLKNITGFANASGGRMFVGIEEGEKDTPKAICGISDAAQERERILSVCLSGIDNRITGLDVGCVSLSAEEDVLVIHIPRSRRKPHMITYRGRQEFWRRHGAQNVKMSVDEILEGSLSVEHERKAFDEFMRTRRNSFLSKIGNNPWFRMSATPSFIYEEIVDVFETGIEDLLKNPPGDYFGSLLAETGIHPSLDGIVCESPGYSHYFLEILRNGHVELQMDMTGWVSRTYEDEKGGKHLVLLHEQLVRCALSFLEFLREFVHRVDSSESSGLHLGLYNIPGWGLHESSSAVHRSFAPRIYTKQHLELPAMRFPSFENPKEVAKILTDRIWNAFGYRKSPIKV